jgi:hypothetical protein
MPIPGLAVDGAHLWVVDPAQRKLWAYDKSDGSAALLFDRASSFSFASSMNPRGIATDGAGAFWIAMAGSSGSARRFVYDDVAHAITPSTTISDLVNPFGVAWYKNGSTSMLFVTEIGADHVRKFDVSGSTPAQIAQWLSPMPGPGLVTDTSVGWQFDNFSWIPGGNAGIAVDPFDGNTFGVVDTWNQRTMFYGTADGAVSPTQRLMGFNFPAPDVDLGVGEDWLMSGWEQYRIEHDHRDPDYGHPWTLMHNWHPTDHPTGLSFTNINMVRRLSNGLEYLYSVVGGTKPRPKGAPLPVGGLMIYRLNADGAGRGIKRCAQIMAYGSTDSGPIEVRTDTNGNGILDDGHGNPDPGDTVRTRTGKFHYPDLWVDHIGTVWIASVTLDSEGTMGVGQLPLAGFDELSNPIYDVSANGPLRRITTVQVDRVSGVAEFQPTHLRTDSAGHRLFQEVITPYRGTGGFNSGGSAVTMLDLNTGGRSTFAIPTQSLPLIHDAAGKPQVPIRAVVGGIAVDTDGNYFYTGDSIGGGPGQEVRMFTWDGLPVATAAPQGPLNGAGWLDIGLSLTAFTHSSGTHYVYAEDIGYGRNVRYAFSNVATTKRSSGTFYWSAPSTADGLVGWWRLDEEHGQYVVDSSGSDHFGVGMGFSGSPNEWNSIGRWNPTGGILHGALSFNGKTPDGTGIVLSKNTAQPVPDDLIENPEYSTVTVTSWIKTSAAGVIMSYQGVHWGLLPKTYVPLMYIGLDGKARGKVNGATDQMVSASIVNDGRWHHLALAVGSDSQSLYVDGVRESMVRGGLVARRMPYGLIGVGYTDSADWPETPQGAGWFYYRGLLDDVRVYGRALSALEIAALACPPAPSGPIAWWKFDEAAGPVAADSSDHGNDATVSGGTWLPDQGRIGGALSFDGRSAVMTPPNGLIENPAYATLTFACWIKTVAGGVLISYQNGPYVESVAARDLSVVSMMYVGLDGFLYASVFTNTNSRRLRSPRAVNSDTWRHVALVVGSTSESLYVDGELVDEVTPAAPWGVLYPTGLLNNQLGVGYNSGNGAPPSWNWTAGGSFFYKGLLDDARLYGRDLSAKEIHDLASMGVSR